MIRLIQAMIQGLLGVFILACVAITIGAFAGLVVIGFEWVRSW